MPHINRIRLVNVNYNDAKLNKIRKAYKKYIYRWKHKKNITLSCRMGT